MQLGGLELDAENLDFRHTGPRRQVDRLWGELVLPDDLLDLLDEQFLQPGVGPAVLIDFVLGQNASESSLFGVGDQRWFLCGRSLTHPAS
ncbi:hypothetical protein D9M70_589390 [compost metagenome]